MFIYKKSAEFNRTFKSDFKYRKIATQLEGLFIFYKLDLNRLQKINSSCISGKNTPRDHAESGYGGERKVDESGIGIGK
ncbi:SprT protein [[Mannheimia] succiniciproducens MBEL55E]|uniref:SprT protein n=1 Tax=Mannheimia succiniciproducens (strain KCTC 0769BP / MBEL55E) TaxID=221988 RepID=Q65RV5_MANSM|nr:SprT protein [[Mannheimia] succiniciproducens MBEL55E]